MSPVFTYKYRLNLLLLLGSVLLSFLNPSRIKAAGYGRLSGVVSDNKGMPLMGAAVNVTGPTAFGSETTTQAAERMLTDANGRFTVSHLLPGWYSLNVSSPTRLPAMRNGVHVTAGRTAMATFVLTDVFAPVKLQMPGTGVSSWEDDWKWVLRASSTTRPILRYCDQAGPKEVANKPENAPLPSSTRYVGVLPGPSPKDPLAEDFGMASVVAYMKAFSPEEDILAEASFAPVDVNSGTIGTALLRNRADGERGEAGLALHQFNLLPGAKNPYTQARALEATYSDTRLIAPHVTVTTGIDISYLSAIDGVFAAQPRVHLEYQATPQTVLSIQYGSAPETGNSMTDRVSLLNSFPQVTQRNNRLEMERLNHTELAMNHRFGKSSRVQLAAYHDSMRNAAIWGLGMSSNESAFVGNSLPNPVGGGIVINGGDYASNGFRAVFARTLDSRVEVLGAVSSGSALSARGLNSQQTFSPEALTLEQTGVFIGKITAEVPGTRTRLSTSYEYAPKDRVTPVDPTMQGNLQTQPYLGVQIRQPIPTPNSWPVRIDAVAEFQNLLSQGYIPAGQGNHKQVVLSSGYHYVRGGFSVQF